MRLQVLVSTMNQKDYSLLERMNIKSDAIVINQCNDKNEVKIDFNDNHIKWINSDDKGLSKSRNLAMENSTAEICILADDDLEYFNEYPEIILNEFDNNPEADIIAFQVIGVEGKFKEYSTQKKKVNILNSLKISSVEVAFRLDKIKENRVKFDEEFGAGSKYFSGEENIFLADCLRSKLKIIYVPVAIANLHLGKSTWFRGYTKEYFISKGAAFRALSKRLSYFLIFQFALRKYYLYKGEMTLRKSLKYMIEGSRLI